jgi:TonB family protein
MSQTSEAFIIALVRRAARMTPSSLSARLEEEWLADMHERTSTRSRLRFAAGCYWAGLAIGLEHRPASVLVASAAHGNATVIVEPPNWFSSRAMTFGLVFSLHAAIFCALMMMAGTKYSKPQEPPAIQPRVIDRAPPTQIKPPPPIIDRSLFDKIPQIHEFFPPIQPEAPPKVVSDLGRGVVETLGSVTAPPREIMRVPGGTGPGFPHPDDYYPDASRRLEEQGATVLQVCVDPAGRLTSDPVQEESSGSTRLDTAAIRLAKAGSGHYRPTSEDGRPVTACYPLKIRFQLRN